MERRGLVVARCELLRFRGRRRTACSSLCWRAHHLAMSGVVGESVPGAVSGRSPAVRCVEVVLGVALLTGSSTVALGE